MIRRIAKAAAARREGKGRMLLSNSCNESSRNTRGVVKLLKPEGLARYIQHHIMSDNNSCGSRSRSSSRKRPSCLLGLDVGGSKIGVSISDSTYTFARPLARIDRRPNSPSRDFPLYVAKQLQTLVKTHNACGLVVGYPLMLWTGQPGARCREVFHFMERVYVEGTRSTGTFEEDATAAADVAGEEHREQNQSEFDLPPFALWDERLTTQEARQTLAQNHNMGKGRQQLLEDQVAATLILQSFLTTYVKSSLIDR